MSLQALPPTIRRRALFLRGGLVQRIVPPSAASDYTEARWFMLHPRRLRVQGSRCRRGATPTCRTSSMALLVEGEFSRNCTSKHCLRVYGGALLYASPASLTRAGFVMQARRNTDLSNFVHGIAHATEFSKCNLRTQRGPWRSLCTSLALGLFLESLRPPLRNLSSILICKDYSGRHIRLAALLYRFGSRAILCDL